MKGKTKKRQDRLRHKKRNIKRQSKKARRK